MKDITENEKDWEYDESFYEQSSEKKVRSFEEITAECQQLMAKPEDENISEVSSEIQKIAMDVANIKRMSAEGVDVNSIAERLDLDFKYVSDILITISGSPEDNSDMAIAYLVKMSQD